MPGFKEKDPKDLSIDFLLMKALAEARHEVVCRYEDRSAKVHTVNLRLLTREIRIRLKRGEKLERATKR